MDRSTASKPSRPRGRPPKVKKGGRKPNASIVAASALATTSNGPAPESTGKNQQRVSTAAKRLAEPDPISSDIPTATSSSSKRVSADGDELAPSGKRTRINYSRNSQTPISQPSGSNTPATVPPASDRKGTATILPARRSTRNATVQSTQISEGTLRPPGPPNLEAALSIALRNLESETWRYLWAYNKEHPAGPLPTPAEVKGACSRVRAAAEAVDKADRELEGAIDEIMLSNTKKKKTQAGSPE